MQIYVMPPDEPENEPKPAAANETADAETADKTDSAEPKPADELKAAFDHLKNAAGLFIGRIQKDDTLRKAAHEAESALEMAATGVEAAAETAAAEAGKAVKTLGERAQPLVKDIGSELSRMAKTIRTALEPEPIPGEPAPGDGAAAPGEKAAEKATDATVEPADGDPEKKGS